MQQFPFKKIQLECCLQNISNFETVNPSEAKTVLFSVNQIYTIIADILTWPSAVMILFVCDMDIIVFLWKKLINL